jgi:hypothetical protein
MQHMPDTVEKTGTLKQKLHQDSVLYIQSQNKANDGHFISIEKQSLSAFEFTITKTNPILALWHLNFINEDTLTTSTPVLSTPPVLLPYQGTLTGDMDEDQRLQVEVFKTKHNQYVFVLATVGKRGAVFSIDPNVYETPLPVFLSCRVGHGSGISTIHSNIWQSMRKCIHPQCTVDAYQVDLSPCKQCYIRWGCSAHDAEFQKHASKCIENLCSLPVSGTVAQEIVFPCIS